MPSSLTLRCIRHCACIYYQDWHRTQRPKPAPAGAILDGVARAVSTQPASTSQSQTIPEFTSPRNTLVVSSGIVVALGDSSSAHLSSPPPATTPAAKAPTTSMSKLPFDEEAKLVYGVIFSLKAMVQKLSGRSVFPSLSAIDTRSSIF
jgi:hypothetical protein